jgi:hypothetical protein
MSFEKAEFWDRSRLALFTPQYRISPRLTRQKMHDTYEIIHL